MTWTVCALYRFVTLDDPAGVITRLKAVCAAHDLCGTLLIAPEGVNGTIAGRTPDAVAALMHELEAIAGISKGEVKYSSAKEKPFDRMKVRLKREIVTLKAPEADPNKQVGTYVDPADWNALLTDPDAVIIDTRNDFEVQMGQFKGAINPKTVTFSEFRGFVQDQMDDAKDKKIVMYCTGGIRCEKASSYMIAHGFPHVYHLKGGILKYLETVAPENSLWEGDCFVFDKRVGLGHGLEESETAQRPGE